MDCIIISNWFRSVRNSKTGPHIPCEDDVFISKEIPPLVCRWSSGNRGQPSLPGRQFPLRAPPSRSVASRRGNTGCKMSAEVFQWDQFRGGSRLRGASCGWGRMGFVSSSRPPKVLLIPSLILLHGNMRGSKANSDYRPEGAFRGASRVILQGKRDYRGVCRMREVGRFLNLWLGGRVTPGAPASSSVRRIARHPAAGIATGFRS